MSKKWFSFCALIPTVALIFLDQSILPVALPTIRLEFNASSTSLQWCVDAYLLTITMFVLISGKIGDWIGYRKALCSGLIGFAVFSILCGLSPNVETLIIARGLQGMSAAFMLPAQTAMMSRIFPQGQRGRAIGLLVSVGSVFLVLGPLVGGYLTESISWRWIFWINLPIAAFGWVMARTFLPITESQLKKIDVLGFLFFACGAGFLTTFFMQVATWGWNSTESIVCLVVILVSFSLLLWREKRTPHPFLELSLFKRPLYVAICISISMTSFIMMIAVFQTTYFQEILQYSPLQTGIITCVAAVPTCFMAPIGGRLSDRFGPQIPVAIGFLSIIFSFFWLASFSTPSSLTLVLALVIFGMGLPLILTPSYSAAISSVPPTKTGVAMGMLSTLRMLANTMGLALIHLFVSTVQNIFAFKGTRVAEIISFSKVHSTLGFLMIVAFAITFVLHHRKSSHHPPDSPAEGWD